MEKPKIQMKNIQVEFDRLKKNGKSAKSMQMREDLLKAFIQGLQAVMPDRLIENSVFVNGTELKISSRLTTQSIRYDLLRYSKILIIGGGKATAGLVKAVLTKVGNILPCYGSINIPKGQEELWGEHIVYTSDSGIHSKIDIVYASHPIPDEDGIKGTKRIMKLASSADLDTLVLVIISGGGSALMPLPKKPITIAALKSLNSIMLESGANIIEINAVRKHISDFKGGQLARIIHPRTAVSLILSDVRGDPIDSIASGPTTYDTSTYNISWQIIEKYRIVHMVPESVRVVLRKGVNGLLSETPKQNNPIFSKITNLVIGSATTAVNEIRNFIENQGYNESRALLSPELFGEAKAMGKKLAELILSDRFSQEQIKRKLYFLNSGECTVTVKGEGKGGRNQEMLLALLEELNGTAIPNFNIAVLSMAFDGIEGNSPSAGAIIDTDTLKEVKNNDLEISKYLSENDSYSFFKQLEDAIEIGQTGTNVNDIYGILIDLTN
ncbi:MAG: DUF4147 domain-containing protein [Candidatus Lokiarchaeota archaeon]|nr:DUF4147 domain-containing protein [Candidatus Lokiarchaeota archaeon]